MDADSLVGKRGREAEDTVDSSVEPQLNRLAAASTLDLQEGETVRLQVPSVGLHIGTTACGLGNLYISTA